MKLLRSRYSASLLSRKSLRPSREASRSNSLYPAQPTRFQFSSSHEQALRRESRFLLRRPTATETRHLHRGFPLLRRNTSARAVRSRHPFPEARQRENQSAGGRSGIRPKPALRQRRHDAKAAPKPKSESDFYAKARGRAMS